MASGSGDPFSRLGIDPRFGLDVAVLDARQRELGKALHPDRHAGAPHAQRRRLLGEAMDVNQAYRELKDPVSRAEALLGRLGVSVEQARERRESPAFLMDVLEQREELAEARAAKDLTRIRALDGRARTERTRIEQALVTSFDQGAVAAALATHDNVSVLEQAVLDGVLELVGRLRYARRFSDEVASIEDELG